MARMITTSQVRVPPEKKESTRRLPPVIMGRREYTMLPDPVPGGGRHMITMRRARHRPRYDGRRSGNRRLWEVLPDGSWKGRRCFIVGGGPSAKNFPWEMLRGELVIGINRAFEVCDPTIIYSMDTRFWGWLEAGNIDEHSARLQRRALPKGKSIRQKFLDYEGFKCWLAVDVFPFPHDVFVLDYYRYEWFSTSLRQGLAGGSNSGFGALNLAMCLGANPIYLIGFDMKGDKHGRQAWFHDGYPSQQMAHIYKNTFIPNFNRVASDIKNRGFQIVNLNPDSALKCFGFGRVEDIKPIRRPLIISYCTKDTGYENEMRKLKTSIRRFGLEYDLQRVPNRGGWQANTYYKATFIREMMEKHPERDLLWLDADAELVQYPILFDNLDADLAVHFRDHAPRKRPLELLSGTIFIKNNALMKQFVKEWETENRKQYPAVAFEQLNLQTVLKRWRRKIKVLELPPGYCQIYDLMAGSGKPVIEQHQASRRLRREVGR